MTAWLIVGSAACVWDDMARWGKHKGRTIVVNRMIEQYQGRIWAGATLHPEMAEQFRAARAGNWRLYAPEPAEGVSHVHPKLRMWNGSSVLYAVRIALAEGADRVVVAGAPLDDSPHCYADGTSLRPHLTQYRHGWERAVPELGGRVRSLSGWTARLLGSPTDKWLNG